MDFPFKVRTSLLISFIAVLCAEPAHSQSSDAASKSASQGIPIEEIIVTATKREADLQSVPLSVSVKTVEELARLGATDFADYALSVPGISFTDIGLGWKKQVIRGISSDAILPEANPTTAFYLDEVPIMGSGPGPHYNADPMLFDIERIEVLRGPQGTLFGASAMGGAIRIITQQPNLSQTEGSVGVTVSSIKNGGPGYELHGMFNMPLNDGQAAVRLVGYHRDMDGFIDNLTTGQNDVNTRDISGARIAATIQLSDKISLTGRIAYQDRKSAGMDIEELADGPRKQSRLPESNGDEWTNYNLVVDANLGRATLVSSTSFLDRSTNINLDISPLVPVVFGVSNPTWTEQTVSDSEFVQEVRVISAEDTRLSWIAGVYYQNLDHDYDADFPTPGFDALTGGLAAGAGAPDNLAVTRSNSNLEQLAIYAELSYAFSSRVDLIAGVRRFDIDRDITANNFGLLSGGNLLESGASSESGVTPKIGWSFTANENLMLYATVAEGFRAGGANTPEGSNVPECLAELMDLGFSEFPTSYDSDSVLSYEVGAKSRWLERRISLNATIYHIDWSDMQTTKFLQCGVLFVENAGDASVDGIELEVESHPTDNIDIKLTAGYTYATLQNDVPNLGGNAGDRIPGVPRFTGNIGVSYYFPAFGGRDGFIHANYQYVSNSYNDFDPATRIEMPSYDIANFRIGLNAQRWSSALFIDNIFDERGILVAEDDILRQSVTATPPRTVGISTNWRF